MMNNPVRDAVYTVTVPADLTASVLAACRAEAAAGIKRTPTPMMRVLPPVTAAAACAAVLGVALYLGGNTPDDLPVLPPVGNESTTTAEVTEPTDTTADTTTTTTAKPTTPTTTEPYILVGGEDDFTSAGDNGLGFASLKRRFISPNLEEKMKEYCDVNAVFQVYVKSVFTSEDEKEFLNFLQTDEEYQSLTKQYEAAREAYKEAEKCLEDCEYPDDDPRRVDLERKKNELDEESTNLLYKVLECRHKPVRDRTEERLSYAAQYSITEPISAFGVHYVYYMQLTADAINELADRGGYAFYLASDPEEMLFSCDL